MCFYYKINYEFKIVRAHDYVKKCILIMFMYNKQCKRNDQDDPIALYNLNTYELAEEFSIQICQFH